MKIYREYGIHFEITPIVVDPKVPPHCAVWMYFNKGYDETRAFLGSFDTQDEALNYIQQIQRAFIRFP